MERETVCLGAEYQGTECHKIRNPISVLSKQNYKVE